MPYLTDVLQWDELEDFQRRMERRNTEEEIPLEEEREDEGEGETIVVKNNGNINCSNDE